MSRWRLKPSVPKMSDTAFWKRFQRFAMSRFVAEAILFVELHSATRVCFQTTKLSALLIRINCSAT